jgi:hypothetical protein
MNAVQGSLAQAEPASEWVEGSREVSEGLGAGVRG